MKKILHIITRLDRGGSSEDVLYSYRHFKDRGADVRIAYGKTVYPSTLLQQPLADAPEDFISLPLLVRSINPFLDLLALLSILKLLYREKPDILHTHTSKAGILGRIAGKLYIMFAKRSLTIIHSTHGHVFYGYYSSPVSRLFILAERIAASFTDRITVLTANEITEHLGRGIGTREKFRIIHSGIDYNIVFKEQNLKSRLAIPDDHLVIGSAGRFDPVKGYRVFIEAASLVERQRPSVKITWLLVGDGTDIKSLKQRARKLGMALRVLFTGWVQNPEDYVVLSDIYVQPSLNEGMGKTVVLAQMLRRPVIASRVQGLVSIIDDGVTGLLVEPADPKALADAIVRLIDDRSQRDHLGIAAQQYAFSRDRLTGHFRFSVSYMNYLTERLYDAC